MRLRAFRPLVPPDKVGVKGRGDQRTKDPTEAYGACMHRHLPLTPTDNYGTSPEAYGTSPKADNC